MADRLDRYREMRDFSRTPEPEGDAPSPPDGAARFVVQEHHATALHWDFRLEHDGVLVSWAIPKGVPADQHTNHLAVQTEDHPLDYIDFEGEIAEGNYGAGRVITWDTGTYETHKFRDREVMVTLHGGRLDGKYVLFKTDGDNWMIRRMDPPQDPAREPMPVQVVPMLAKPSGLPRDDDTYAFEVKWDGIRAIAFSEGGRVRLQSRNLLDLTKQYPELAGLGEQLGAHEAVLDGEIVALDEQGRPSFELLQGRMGLVSPGDIRRRMKSIPTMYMIFDLLYLDGHSAMQLPYEERRRLLEALALDGPSWKTPAYHPGEGLAMLEGTRAKGVEGVMAKRLDSQYQPGRRSGAWLKIKNTYSQDFVIGGWTPGEGVRTDLPGALLLGYYDSTPAEADQRGEPQRLAYAGKVGTGFTESFLRRLMPRLQELAREMSPFVGGPPEPGAFFVEPRLVGEVVFAEWTQAKVLRHPSFKGLRPDKEPRDVVFERADMADSGPIEVEVAEPAPRRDARTPRPRTEGSRMEVEVEGRRLTLSNLEKVLYPEAGFTKAQMLDYYTRIAPVMLPHICGRPMTLKRYPDGVEREFFYEKECPSFRPEWLKTAAVWSGSNGKAVNYALVDDLPSLIWLANLATLEFHPMLARARDVWQPTTLVFDLDPGAPATIVECGEVALLLRELFDTLGLQAFPKTSGSKGLQVYVPLNTRVTYDETRPFARAVAQILERQQPKLVVSNMSKAVRGGRVLVDWSQNAEHKTTVAVYSLRARSRPTVSTPVTWEEVEGLVATREGGRLAFEAGDALERVAWMGDLFAPVLELEQGLPRL